MDKQQYTGKQIDAMADAFLASHARPKVGRKISVKPKSSKPRYGKASATAASFLRVHGANGSVPSAKELADAILRRNGQPFRDLGKGAAKKIVVEFAAQVIGKRIAAATLDASSPIRAVAPTKDFYWSEAWRSVRYIALRSSRGVCELCCAPPSPGHPLHVDHIKPRSRFPELELDPTNLQVLCEDCNLGKSNTDTIDWRRNAG